jgi:hypothetical protein
MVYSLALLAALIVGVGEVVQQRVAMRAPPDANLSPRLLWWLARRPEWLGGVGFSLLGNVLFAGALTTGSVVLVEAVFLTRLVFGLVVAAFWAWHRIPLRDLAAAVGLLGSIVVFLLSARPRAGHLNGARWLIAIVPPVLLSVGVAAVASRQAGARRATLLGGSAGVLFGLQTVLVKTAVHTLSQRGPAATLAGWRPYAVVGVALLGTLMVQSAFESAPLPASYPAVVTGQLLCAMAISVWVLHGAVRAATPYAYFMAGSLVSMLAAITVLTRSPLLTSASAAAGPRPSDG